MTDGSASAGPLDLRIGTGLDVHRFGSAPGPLRLAGVEIDAEHALEGHSDADVVAHAVADALLGALARGDLGARFGVDAPETAGADSLALLREVATETAVLGWYLVNLDVVVVAQRPPLAPHRDAMRQRLAAALATDVARVSVKFTTTDQLGSIGRAEGVACFATVLVQRQPGGG